DNVGTRGWTLIGSTLRGVGWKRGAAVACVALIAVAGASCNVIPSGPDRTRGVFHPVRNFDLLPRHPGPQGAAAARAAHAPRAASYYGNEVVAAAAAPGAAPGQRAAGGGEGYELNFENTPVTTVAKVVLGDILGVGYTIDPRVQGTVSLASGRP